MRDIDPPGSTEQYIDDMEFVFRKYLRETVGVLDGFCHRGAFIALGIAQAGAIENVGAHSERFRGLSGDRQRIAGHHRDLDAHLYCGRDGRFGVFPRRVEQR